MKNDRHLSYRNLLLMGSSLVGLIFAGPALAQQTADNSPSLERVVGTATQQASTVNKAPLAVSAVSQADLNQLGIQKFSHLVSHVPGLYINQQLGNSVANAEIHDIAQGSQGAATTGFYLDDTPISRRNVGGGVATSNSTLLPPLFDLQRVEVLRGPQGTLYDSGSEGGTVRYHTPAPNLDKFKYYTKASGMTTEYGSPGFDAGLAIGAVSGGRSGCLTADNATYANFKPILNVNAAPPRLTGVQFAFRD